LDGISPRVSQNFSKSCISTSSTYKEYPQLFINSLK
jgi:hypothetical protein